MSNFQNDLANFDLDLQFAVGDNDPAGEKPYNDFPLSNYDHELLIAAVEDYSENVTDADELLLASSILDRLRNLPPRV